METIPLTGVLKPASVLFFLKGFYLSMALVVVLATLFFAWGVSRRTAISIKAKALFYGWVTSLVAIGIVFHLLTAWQIPWVRWEIQRDRMTPDREIEITARSHQFVLPPEGLRLKVGEMVKFKVRSEDLSYGFGIFHPSGAMEFQMQVLPNHWNEIVWIFRQPGDYTIRSTEYAGPDTDKMRIKDALQVLPQEA